MNVDAGPACANAILIRFAVCTRLKHLWCVSRFTQDHVCKKGEQTFMPNYSFICDNETLIFITVCVYIMFTNPSVPTAVESGGICVLGNPVLFFLSCLAHAPCCCFISHHLLSLGVSLDGTPSITHTLSFTHTNAQEIIKHAVWLTNHVCVCVNGFGFGHLHNQLASRDGRVP